VIADSIVDSGATITDSVLRDSIIGENASVAGQSQTLILGDDSRVEPNSTSIEETEG
jgi:hypothetical protein